MSIPWLGRSVTVATSPEERAKSLNAHLPLDGQGAVLVTHPCPPQGDEAPMSIGAALDASLVGSTSSFTMLVAYFAHGGANPAFRSDLHDPASLILRELNDLGDHAHDALSSETRFRLLFGELRSQASALALHLWWALCRWRRDAGAPLVDAWRAQFLSALREAVKDPTRSDQALRRLARRVLDSGDSLSPFAAGRATHPSPEATVGHYASINAGLLLLFLIQRAADIRCGRDLTRSQRIFHPKLYVVERKADRSLDIIVPDTVVIAGSANWSGAAGCVSHPAHPAILIS